MLLQTNSCSSFSLKYHPLQHAGSFKTIQTPMTQTNGLVNRIKSNKCSIRRSIQNSLYLTNKKIRNHEDMMERRHKPLKKSTVPMALQDDYPSKSQDENVFSTSFVDVLTRKLHALYRLSRPYAWIAIIVGTLSTSLLAVETLADLTPTFFIEVLKSMVPTLMMNIFVSAINQLSDIEIDKVNKPNLPLASGDFSIGEGIAIAVISTLTSLGMGVMLRSPPLVIGLITRWIVGTAYSVDLPLLRWKASPLMAGVTIIILSGTNVLPYFVHIQKYVLGRPVVFTKPLLFSVIFMGIIGLVLAFLKDIPDVEGDKEFGIRTLPVILGKERVFSISISMLLLAYGGAALAGISSPFLICKLVTMIGHSVLGFILWRKAQTVDLSNTKSAYSFFIFIFQLYYAEFFLMHFVR